MMSRLLVALTINAVMALNSGATATECCRRNVLDTQIGRSCGAAREFLIAHGYHPSARKRNADEECLLFRDVCRRFPEVGLCGAADDRPCVFDWLSESGRPMVVDTVGEHPADLTVIGLGPR